jgi:putative SbcD/Mre11-related phosphoesterase
MQVHHDWLLTAERAAIHLPTSTAVIADLHLGYNQVRVCTGEAVPIAGLEDVVAALDSLVAKHNVYRLVIAGDLFEDARYSQPVAELLDWLERSGVELTAVVPGNHDRGLAGRLGTVPVQPEGVDLGSWRVVHGDGRLPPGRLVMGHHHPCFRWADKITAPCYLVARDQIVLPAFSPDAAGINVLHSNQWWGYKCCVIAGDDVLDFGDVAGLRKAIQDAH